jgi:hypothetical protein
MPESLKILYFFFKNKNTGVFWECWQDLTTNPNGAPLSETFGNVDTPV